jgi:hypothetical protein
MDQTCVEQKTTRRSLRWSYECVGTYHEEIETSNYRSYRALPDVYEAVYRGYVANIAVYSTTLSKLASVAILES